MASVSTTSTTHPSTPSHVIKAKKARAEARRKELLAHKATEKAECDAWNAEADMIEAALNAGQPKHGQVNVFYMNDGDVNKATFRQRVLVFQTEVVDFGFEERIRVKFQGVVFRSPDPMRRRMTRRERVFNRLIALRRLRDNPRILNTRAPTAWNAEAYNAIRKAVRKDVFKGLTK